MIRGLRNNLIVELDDSLPTQSGLILPVNTKEWREARDQIGNRARVVSTGNGWRTKKKGSLVPVQVRPGDVVRLSELQYPHFHIGLRKLYVVNEMDVVGVETTKEESEND